MNQEIAEYIAKTANKIAEKLGMNIDLGAVAEDTGTGDWCVVVSGWGYEVLGCAINRETIAATIVTAGYEIGHEEYAGGSSWDEPQADYVMDTQVITPNAAASVLVELVVSCMVQHALQSVAHDRMMADLAAPADGERERLGSKIEIIETKYKTLEAV